ncbi:MAG: hypothetical protein H6671_15280 [Anaerolineaceae bacterium]|nr:hypothetical protein [Anaerolineaceae bacterium]
MSNITIVDNDYMLIEYLSDKKIISHVVRKPVSGKPFRDALNAGTDALIQYGACKWMSDDRLNGPLPQADVDWGNNEWNARTVAGGWKFWALVVPQEVAAAGSLIPVVESLYERGLRVMVFTKTKDALDWLDKQQC